MKRINFNECVFMVLAILIIFIPFREILAFYCGGIVKAIPDVLIGLLLIGFVLKSKFRFRFALSDIFFIGYLLVELVSTCFINDVGIKSFIVQTRSISLFYILYFILRNHKIEKQYFYKLLPILKSVVFVLFALCVVEKIFAKEFLFPNAWRESIIYMDNYIRTYSMFNNPNTYAAFMAFALIYSYQLQVDFWSKKNFPYAFCLITGILLSVSRSTIILMFMFFIIDFIIKVVHAKKYQLKILFPKIMLVCVISGCAAWGGIEVVSNYFMEYLSQEDLDSNMSSVNRFSQLFNSDIVNQSTTNGRMYSITKGLEIFKDYPIVGAGFGTYGSSASLINGSPLYEKYDVLDDFYSDNEYIKVLVEGGVIGFVLFCGFLISILWSLRKNHFKLLVCVVMGGLGMFYNIFEVQILAFLFYLTLVAPNEHEERLINHDS